MILSWALDKTKIYLFIINLWFHLFVYSSAGKVSHVFSVLIQGLREAPVFFLSLEKQVVVYCNLVQTIH